MIGYLFGFSFLYNILNNCATILARQSCLKLDEDNYINIIKMDDDSNNYAINSDTYLSKYFVNIGTFRIVNIPETHQIAILNKNIESKIYINPIDTTPIIINVKGGSFSKDKTGDYYIFSINSKQISINKTFYFMIGRTYRFIADNINNIHPFEIFVNNNRIKKPIINNGEFIDLKIEENSDIYYQCTKHPYMKDTLKFLTRYVAEDGENNSNYNFYYGDIDIIVEDNFDEVSLYCFGHGYMGGKNMLKFNENCR